MTWCDFHSNLASQIQSQLNAQIQPHYFVTIETTVVYQTIEVDTQEKYVIYPDVDVRQQQRQSVSDSVYVILSREERRPKVEVWPIQLSEALPPIPVPLRPGCSC